MEPADYLRALRPRWWVILLTVLVGVAAALATMPSATKYEATHTLIVRSTGGDAAENPEQSVSALAFLMTTEVIAERVAATLGEDDPSVLSAQVEAEADETLGTISATVTADSAEQAEAIANAFGTELLAHLDEESEASRQETVAGLTAAQDELEREIADIEQQIAGGNSSATLLSQRDAKQQELSGVLARIAGVQDDEPAAAQFSEVPASAGLVGSIGRTTRVIIGGGVGLLLGTGLALVLARFDRRIRTREEAEDAFGHPVVAEIPRLTRRVRKSARIVVNSDPESLAAEAYRGLRTAVARAGMPNATKSARRRAGGTRVVLVVSPGISEGKTSTVANLAAAYAEAGSYVLVLGCDLRRPGLGRMLDVTPEQGLSEVLSERPDAPRLGDVIRTSSIDRVRVVTSGRSPGNPSELIARVPNLISNARDYADVVIVDSAPFLATDDVSGMVPVVDAVVVCCRAGQTTLDAARRTTDRLNRLGAPVVGLALVEAPRIPTGRSYHYAYYLPRQAGMTDPESIGTEHVSTNGGSLSSIDRVTHEDDETGRPSTRAGEHQTGPRKPAS